MAQTQLKITSKKEQAEQLTLEINSCRKCSLWETRNKPLVGDGPVDAEILVIGESPGYHEDKEGRAFVGEAGKILDQLLDLANLKRDAIYITNILKCHPPKNHNPNRKQIDSCMMYLDRQIEMIKPKIIITLGRFASREIFTKFNLEFTRISQVRGKIFEAKTSYGNIIIIPMYHPAVACYRSEMLDVLKDDFNGLKDIIR